MMLLSLSASHIRHQMRAMVARSQPCIMAPSASRAAMLALWIAFSNIWTNFLPKYNSTTKDLKPVMPNADGGNIASRGDVVAVGINYRLTTLGLFALDDGVTNDNFGLAHQVNAFDWVRKNIKDFGGDPQRITLWGQSAGAGSFAGAIPLSNPGGINHGTTYPKYYTIEEEMEVAGNAILNATDCTDAVSQVDCLGAISAYDLANLDITDRYPVVEGTYLTSDELELYGPPLPVRPMMGLMRDDGAAMISYPKTTNEPAFLNASGFSVHSGNLFLIPNLEN
ncbi:putative Carboxylic ester hydrolase [Seiridium unicorne]|uniref:Carboxylic ester hydrolase n=1 Tax=Seiridium unicorne TaxID=138068 RepID=A0ABR2V7I9_9PEZI